MSRRDQPPDPALHLDFAVIAAQEQYIRGVLQGLGVRGIDVDDLSQDVLLGAWKSMQAGRFRPQDGKPLQTALRVWLYGICFNQASHYHQRAFRHREVPMAEPWHVMREPSVSDEDDRAARLVVESIRALPPRSRKILSLVAMGHEMNEIAKELGISVSATHSRLRKARKRLAALLARGGPPTRRGPTPKHELGHRDAIRTHTRVERVVVEVRVSEAKNLLRIPKRVTEDDLQELIDAGFEVSEDIWGEPIAKAPGAPWFSDAAYELAKLRFRRDR